MMTYSNAIHVNLAALGSLSRVLISLIFISYYFNNTSLPNKHQNEFTELHRSST